MCGSAAAKDRLPSARMANVFSTNGFMKAITVAAF